MPRRAQSQPIIADGFVNLESRTTTGALLSRNVTFSLAITGMILFMSHRLIYRRIVVEIVEVLTISIERRRATETSTASPAATQALSALPGSTPFEPCPAADDHSDDQSCS